MSTVYPYLIFLVVFYYLLRPLYLGFRFAYPTRLKLMFFTPTALGVEYEEVTLRARDGVLLDGWYISSHNGASVILLHGHAGNRLSMVPLAESLLRAGYGVLLLDLRAHGMSGGRRFGRSSVLVDDVLTAVTYLHKRPDVNAAGIGLCGTSVGALFALHAAAKTVAVRAIVADRPAPATMSDLPRPRFGFEQLAAWPIQQLYMLFGKQFSRMPPLPPTIEILPRIAPRPILYLSNARGAEQRICKHLFGHTSEKKEHQQIDVRRYTRKEQREAIDSYGKRVVNFFDEHLRIM